MCVCSNSAKKDSFLDGDKESHQGNPIILDTPLATQTGHHQLFPFFNRFETFLKKVVFLCVDDFSNCIQCNLKQQQEIF